MNAQIALAVIGGTGLYALSNLGDVRTQQPETPYGTTSAPIRIGRMAGAQVAFLARHGESHNTPPHRINYRANLWALQKLGVQRVLAINSVGGISEGFGPRVIALPDQLIDYTSGREHTFSDGVGSGDVQHADFGDPYSASLREVVLAAADSIGVSIIDGGCYGATQGPRLESRAEIARLQRDGCDLVGMTGMPEAGLARELGLDYACLALVANWAAGCGLAEGEQTPVITMDDVLANMAAATAPLPDLLAALVNQLS
ncbi:MAG: S-methyl-5'-thioinosine phosphorylase [Lysobacteraceae bacterium]